MLNIQDDIAHEPDEAKNDIMTFQEMLDVAQTEVLVYYESNQCLDSSSDQGDFMGTEVDGTIKTPKGIEYSADNSSVIENPDHHTHTPRLDEFNRLVAQVKSEGYKIQTEIVTHEIAGMATGPETCKRSRDIARTF